MLSGVAFSTKNNRHNRNGKWSHRYNGKCVARDKSMFAVELVATSGSTATSQSDDFPFPLFLLLNPHSLLTLLCIQ